jgi:lipopolysaccharide export LptBFGC system permease protein LptF
LNRIVRGYPPRTSPFNQRWIIGRNGSFYHYSLFDSTGQRFLNLWTYRVAKGEWRLDEVTFATDASLLPKRAAVSPDYSLWLARRGWTRQFHDVPEVASKMPVKYEPFVQKEIALETPDYFSSQPSETEQMTFDQMLTFGQLQEFIEQLRVRGDPVVAYVVRLHRKVAFPFVTVIMTLLAIPFAASGGRRGALYGIGVGIVLALGYFVTMSVFGALGTGGFLTPVLAAWAPNLLFAAAAGYMILTVRT